MSEECRFAHETCLTHPLHIAALCSHAADALRAKVAEAEMAYNEAEERGYRRYWGEMDSRIRELESLLTTRDEKIAWLEERHAEHADVIYEYKRRLEARDTQVGVMRYDMSRIAKAVRENRQQGVYTDDDWLLSVCNAALSGGRESVSPGPACPRCGLFLAVPNDCPFCGGREEEKS